jgi:hypothetical protein
MIKVRVTAACGCCWDLRYYASTEDLARAFEAAKSGDLTIPDLKGETLVDIDLEEGFDIMPE